MRRKVEKDYHELAELRGFKWVGAQLPKNTYVNTLWECKFGHQWLAVYHNIYTGTGCPFCAGQAKKIEKDYHELADSCGFKWVDEELPKNIHSKTLWECKKGHQWRAIYNNINKGSGCPFCAGKFKKIEKDYYDLAESKGFKWVGKELLKNTKIKTSWECKNGHKWRATYSNIHKGSGCPKCAGLAKKEKQDYYDLVGNRNIIWVGGVLPKNVMIKTSWECKKCGYQWRARYNNIQQGNGCPCCQDMLNGSPVSKPQRKLNDLLCGSLNYPEAQYAVDVAIMRNSQKIAVEYDAQYWHQGNEEHDKKRDKFLISRGWKVLHIKSGTLLPTRKQLKKKINKLLKNNINIIDLYLEDWKKEDK